MTISLRRQVFRVLSIASFLVLVLCFQNCSQVQFLANDAANFFKSENNGGGYTGKPDGDFYRFVPGFTCEEKESFQSHIHISGDAVTLKENKKTMCAASGQALDPKLLDLSIYQSEILGYKEGIFEAQSITPTSIPANLVEVWCRDSKDSSGIETITHYDRDSQLAVTRIYYTGTDRATGAIGPRRIPDFKVSRLVKGQLITIRDESGFELLVHRDQIAAEAGLFKGHLKATIDGASISRDTSCRVGGSLDATVWPAKQIVDVDVLNFKISGDQNQMGYVPRPPSIITFPSELFVFERSQQKHTLLTSALSAGVNFFEFTSDSKNVIYMVNGSAAPKVDLVSTRSDLSSSLILSSSPAQSSVYRLSGDGQTVIYNSGWVLYPSVHSVAVDGSSGVTNLTAFNTDPAIQPGGAQTMVSGAFDVSRVGHKVVFTCCNSKVDLYSSNIDGSDLRLITPPLPAGFVVRTATFPSPNSDQIIKVYAWTNTTLNGPITELEFLMRVDGTDVFPLTSDWRVISISPDSGFAALRNSRSEWKLVNLASRTEMVSPALSPLNASSAFFFTRDSSNYVIATLATNGLKQIKSMSTASGALTDICPSAANIVTQEIRPGMLAVLTEDISAKQLRIYVSSLNGSCRLVNSLPIDEAATSPMQMQISADGQKLLVQHQSNLLYVPLDGKPAYQINAPVHTASMISAFYFLADSRTVIFLGDQIRKNENQVFSWVAP